MDEHVAEAEAAVESASADLVVFDDILLSGVNEKVCGVA
jgi:hypothetical protein